jgi:pimeloyl-ACP methyl ester carboxylesterase
LTTYAVDLPGHGKAGSQAETTIGGYASRLLAWLRELDLPPVVLAGHSMGGAIALVAALRTQRQLAGLALIASSARLRVSPELLEMSREPDRFEEAVDWVMAASFAPQAPQDLIQQVRRQLLMEDPRAFHLDFKICDQFDVRDRLHEIGIPALILSGRQDRMTPPFLAEELDAGLERSSLYFVEGAGHLVMQEDSDQVGKVVRDFVLGLADVET